MGLLVNRCWLLVFLGLTLIYSCGSKKESESIEINNSKVEEPNEPDKLVPSEIPENEKIAAAPQILRRINIDSNSFAELYEFGDYVLKVVSIDSSELENFVSRTSMSDQLSTIPASPLVQNDTSLVLEFEMTESDTLFSRSDSVSGYFQRYTMNEEWRGNYVVRYQDWESSDVYLINKVSGKWFSLGGSYLVQGDTLIYLNAELQNPLVSNFLGMAVATKDSIEELFMFNFTTIKPLSIEKTDQGFLLKTGVDGGNYKPGSIQWYAVTFKNSSFKGNQFVSRIDQEDDSEVRLYQSTGFDSVFNSSYQFPLGYLHLNSVKVDKFSSNSSSFEIRAYDSLQKWKDCIILKFEQGADTLCNQTEDDEYFYYYDFQGLYKNYYVVYHQETDGDYIGLYHRRNGTRFFLGFDYLIKGDTIIQWYSEFVRGGDGNGISAGVLKEDTAFHIFSLTNYRINPLGVQIRNDSILLQSALLSLDGMSLKDTTYHHLSFQKRDD
ncbi:hypothetical protein [Roseivirga pacifica]|uniref:hypothetical protein n=1 Tax=Roseivirga pacifica TaxID=1267423 RepID=UPI00209648AF|nr:hypothetical protein [Roseivirga pacifica]MCO6357365.1 hypothetical protein [Roseivirga pacifica]MCO6367921.1 hypothetical protein [Roseivirga pacifica]MCO6369597.1 hypothetical protein [Roseivirga pacifica]MCO6373451.1 hypothetical protein [Roseivirga pacifica]MCO6377292.1 hypothetical protein [Roseivirga pacifica]